MAGFDHRNRQRGATVQRGPRLCPIVDAATSRSPIVRPVDGPSSRPAMIRTLIETAPRPRDSNGPRQAAPLVALSGAGLLVVPGDELVEPEIAHVALDRGGDALSNTRAFSRRRFAVRPANTSSLFLDGPVHGQYR